MESISMTDAAVRLIDPWTTLGVTKDSPASDIKKAWVGFIKVLHPDKCQEQSQDQKLRFLQVQYAYEVLTSDEKMSKWQSDMRDAQKQKDIERKAAQRAAQKSGSAQPGFKHQDDKDWPSAKPNVSVPRSSTTVHAEFTTRASPPRASSYKQGPSQGPSVKVFTSYSRSYEDERRSSTSYHETPSRSARREGSSYTEKSSKREDRERESSKEKEKRKKKEKEREKEREREEDARREKAEKAEKKARERSDKKVREKQRSKNIKRESAEKMQSGELYIEDWSGDDRTAKSERQKSSRKHEEPRERSSHRDEPTSARRYSSKEPSLKEFAAMAYIKQTMGMTIPAAPTPPPLAGGFSAFAPPTGEEEPRRSSARTRRHSNDVHPPSSLPRERSYHRSSREALDREEPIIFEATPSPRHSMNAPDLSGSPPHMSRSTARPSGTPARPIPGLNRSNTFSAYPSGTSPSNRGRDRSRMQPQVPEETESDDEYDPPERYRSSRKTRSPEPLSREHRSTTYHAGDGRMKASSSYSRSMHAEQPGYYYPYEEPKVRIVDAGPPPVGSYDRKYHAPSFSRPQTSKYYDKSDVSYTSYTYPTHAQQDARTSV